MKALRIIGKVLLGLVALIVLVVAVSYPVSAMKLKKKYDVTPAPLAVPTDSASVARGRTLAGMYGCTGCHAGNLAGQLMFDGFPFARIASINLTRGRGGIGGTYTDADWDRAIRHGVRPDGRPLLLMPSHEYNRALGDADVAQLIAYLKSLPAVDNEPVASTLHPIGRVIHMTGGGALMPAADIDHAKRVVAPPPGATVAYGEYRARFCQVCHGMDLGGAKSGPEPGSPPVPNITPAAPAGKWTEAEFISAMRTGVTPAGARLNPQFMPWKSIGELTDDELRGIWMYLRTVKPVPLGAPKS